MTFRPLLALFVAVALTAQTLPPAPTAAAPHTQKVARKKSGKKKWIVIAAVTGGVVVGLLVLNARLRNEGGGI